MTDATALGYQRYALLIRDRDDDPIVREAERRRSKDLIEAFDSRREAINKILDELENETQFYTDRVKPQVFDGGLRERLDRTVEREE